LGEVNGVELFLEEPFSFDAQEGEVVEAGVWGWSRDRIRFDVGVDGGDDAIRFGESKEGVVKPDLDAGQVEGVIAEFDGLAAQVGGDTVAVSAEGEGGGLGDLALVTVEEGLTQFKRVGGTGGGGGVLAEAFEGGLAGFGVEFALVDDLDPGQEGLVELGEGGDGGEREFGQEVGLDELEEAFDLAPAFGIVGGAEDTLDAQGGADRVEVLGGVDLALVYVDGEGAAVAQDGALEAVLHARELFVPIELGVRDETGVVVEKGKEEGLALLVGVGRVGEVGAVHRIPLPQVAEVSALEAAVGFGPLLDEELGRCGASEGELAAQGAGGDAHFGDGVGPVEREDGDDGAGGAEGLLALEGFGPVEGLRRESAGLSFVSSRLGLEAVEAALLVETFPAGEGGGADGATGGVGDVVAAGGDLPSQLLLAPRRVLAPQQGQDERVAKEGDFGTSVFRVGHGSASWCDVGLSIAEGGRVHNAKLCW